MWTNLNGLEVRFRHDSNQKISECITLSPKGDTYIGMRAKCSAKDEFSRETGRKIALARLMAHLSLSREDKFNKWEAYRVMTKTPRWPATILGAKRIKKERKRKLKNQVI